jgi:hypothetical protein
MVLGFLAACNSFRDCSRRSNRLGYVGRLRDYIPSFSSVKMGASGAAWLWSGAGEIKSRNGPARSHPNIGSFLSGLVHDLLNCINDKLW